LYESITTEGWLDVMYKGIDSVDIGKQPKLNNNMMLSLYFISFIIIGNIFILNLFVGIVIDKFNRLKDRMCGYALMTRDQKEWVETEKQMIRLELE
jgi:voltage-gated cation channel